MNKSIIYSTIIGTIVYFALGWLFYGTLFTDLYPESEGQSVLYIFLGCLFYVLIFSIVYSRWAHIGSFRAGAKVGLIMGLLYAVSMNFFMSSSMGDLDIERFITDVLIAVVSTALMGGVVGFTIGKSK